MNEKLEGFIKHRATLPVVVGVLAFGSGLVAGYFLGRRQKQEGFTGSTKVSNMIAGTDEYDAGINKVREQLADIRANRKATPPPVVIDADEHAKKVNGPTVDESVVFQPPSEEVIQPASSPEPDTEVTVNGAAIKRSIFPDTGDDWNMEEELKSRTPDRPYTIHREEFFEEREDEPKQRVLTYYNGDDTLCDEDNSPIYNYSQVVGELKFGHGSGDPNVVYIRNEKLKCEYEVILDAGLYSMEVLGVQVEDNQKAKGRGIQHSGIPRFPKE